MAEGLSKVGELCLSHCPFSTLWDNGTQLASLALDKPVYLAKLLICYH
jgi:hypothetical protein